ncbi:nucleotidyltransferase family protein [Pseudocolwellia agarivorans]|uniref:nucleotidyltransferase family protein n=1 Tax=Pseudocolwellia agarivorans TaxID=1911682 RepID=UPI000986F057|nr:nucleotidyltransferase family protein [Pseudocolwellia agarivorans]
MDNFAVIILAAGKSSRLGHPKQLVEINGESLLARQCRVALSITKHVYCVLGYEADLLKPLLISLPVKVVANPLWQQGMSSSISVAIKCLPEAIEHVMIVLVDQWQINKSLLIPLIDTSLDNKCNIVTSSCSRNNNMQANHKTQFYRPSEKRIGPPTIFPKKYFSELSLLSGEKGAKALMMKQIDQVIKVNLPEAFIDLDTTNDLSKLRDVYPE